MNASHDSLELHDAHVLAAYLELDRIFLDNPAEYNRLCEVLYPIWGPDGYDDGISF